MTQPPLRINLLHCRLQKMSTSRVNKPFQREDEDFVDAGKWLTGMRDGPEGGNGGGGEGGARTG